MNNITKASLLAGIIIIAVLIIGSILPANSENLEYADSTCPDINGDGLCDSGNENAAGLCPPPNTTINGECCLDSDADEECDKNQTIPEDICVAPKTIIEGECCLDDDGDNRCD